MSINTDSPVSAGSRLTLGVGWDVGGWLGKRQAVAVVEQVGENHEWRGKPAAFSFASPGRTLYSGESLIELIRRGWHDVPVNVLQRYRVILAIDAPLGLPREWQRLFSDGSSDELPLTRQINNPFAYRETDRWVFAEHHKTPLSVTFDLLGSNASVAK